MAGLAMDSATCENRDLRRETTMCSIRVAENGAGYLFLIGPARLTNVSANSRTALSSGVWLRRFRRTVVVVLEARPKHWWPSSSYRPSRCLLPCGVAERCWEMPP
jgi:hypothetical protein